MFNNDSKVKFEDLPIDEKFKVIFSEYKRKIEENVLFDILRRFYFADWTRACDYEKMTPEEVVNAVISVCNDIEKDWNYDLDDDIMPSPSSFDWEGDYLD